MELVRINNLVLPGWASELFEDLIHAVGAWLLKPRLSKHPGGFVLTSVETLLVPNYITTHMLPWVRTNVYLV